MVSGTERKTDLEFEPELEPKRITKVRKAGQRNDNGRKLYLVGFMASGKSQLGRRLSALLDCPLYDTDLCIAQQTGMSVPEIFARRGETWFREAESRLIRSLPDEACVVVTGGGLPCREENMEYMCQDGITVYIDVPEEILIQRLLLPENRAERPLLNGMKTEEISFFVKNKLKEREYFYKQAERRFRPEEEDFASFLRWARKAMKRDIHEIT